MRVLVEQDSISLLAYFIVVQKWTILLIVEVEKQLKYFLKEKEMDSPYLEDAEMAGGKFIPVQGML